MTDLPRAWPYPALLLCLALAGCGKSLTPEVPAGAGPSPGYDTGSLAEPPAPSPAAASTTAPPASAPK